jgi:hypothetical protein
LAVVLLGAWLLTGALLGGPGYWLEYCWGGLSIGWSIAGGLAIGWSLALGLAIGLSLKRLHLNIPKYFLPRYEH